MLVNIIKEQEARYIFASKIVTGKVLDISYGRFMAYHAGKILLDGNANEVWNYDFLDPEHIDVRKYADSNIIFENFDLDIFNEKFDSIILFNSSYLPHDISTSISTFSRLLTDGGVFIISIFNGKLNSKNFTHTENLEILTKDQLEKILSSVFSEINFYSQLLLSQKHVLIPYLNHFTYIQKSIRSILGNILLKIDNKSIFYRKFLLKYISKFDQSSEKYKENLFHNEYHPIKFENNHNPTYFIVTCKK